MNPWPPSARAGRAERKAAAEQVHALAARPLISIVMPAYETEPAYLKAAIASVQAQAYPDWELCIANDGSKSAAVRRVIDASCREDPRIRAVHLERNSGISAASNAALKLAGGDYVAFLDHDDELTHDALMRVAQALDADPELDVIYSDSDKRDLLGRLVDPFLKPDWSPTYALGAMYIGHLLVVRRAIVEEVGGFDSAFDKIQDFELMLRVCERTERIHHVRQILYHWRAVPGSIAAGALEKSGVPELQARAVSEHLRRIGAPAAAVPHPSIPHRALLQPTADARDELAARAAAVTAVIASSGDQAALERLLGSIARAAELRPGEIVVVAPRRLDVSAEVPGTEIRWEIEADAGRRPALAANAGARAAQPGEVLFLSDRVEVASADWLEQLLVHTGLPGVAAAGPLLQRPDGRVAAAGTALGLDEPTMPMLAGLDADADGYYGALACARDVSALSADCMLVSRDELERAGGFNEAFFTGYGDFDLCQRLRAAGKRLAYVPSARVVVHDLPRAERERIDLVDRALFVERWYGQLEEGDPYYNRGFRREAADFVPAAAVAS